MMYLVDTVRVAPEQLPEYLDVLTSQVVPLYRDAGATFEYCRTTDGDLGEAIEVQLAWSFEDNAAWNGIRRTLVTDGRYYESALALAALRRDGTRRFHRDAPSRAPGR